MPLACVLVAGMVMVRSAAGGGQRGDICSRLATTLLVVGFRRTGPFSMLAEVMSCIVTNHISAYPLQRHVIKQAPERSKAEQIKP